MSTKKKISLVLADDHPVFRAGLKQVLAEDPGIDVLCECQDGESALAEVKKLRPDVLLTDVNMPGESGLDLARIAQREQWNTRIVLLTAHQERDLFDEAMDLGVMGFVLKESASSDIRQAIRMAADDKPFISSALSEFLLKRRTNAEQLREDTPGIELLTDAELRILKLIASDRTSKEIADELGISPRTVDNHRANMSAKLGLSGAHSLVKFAFENRSRL